jgi:hypothetical protein
MLYKKILLLHSPLFAFLLLAFEFSHAQMVTGIWHGKIDKQKVEVKMVQNGDSLAGTAYYFESSARYRRYSIKGYLDETDNSVVWWDDQLLEDKTKGLNLFSRNKQNSSRADFNCPGGGVMMLDGKMYTDADQQKPGGEVHLSKVDEASFKDEWDDVIQNYTVGANDPDMIDSVSQATQKPLTNETTAGTTNQEKTKTISPPIPFVRNEEPKKEVVSVPVIKQENQMETNIAPPTIEQKFTSREKIFTKEIPVSGDSLELDFYDNAEIDGDSISLFLNGKLIFEHIRLTEKAYKIKIPVSDLQETSELIMVAENLGAIPPNTSYMIAFVGEKRYDAQLASTENSSAMIKLVKRAP